MIDQRAMCVFPLLSAFTAKSQRRSLIPWARHTRWSPQSPLNPKYIQTTGLTYLDCKIFNAHIRQGSSLFTARSPRLHSLSPRAFNTCWSPHSHRHMANPRERAITQFALVLYFDNEFRSQHLRYSLAYPPSHWGAGSYLQELERPCRLNRSFTRCISNPGLIGSGSLNTFRSYKFITFSNTTS